MLFNNHPPRRLCLKQRNTRCLGRCGQVLEVGIAEELFILHSRSGTQVPALIHDTITSSYAPPLPAMRYGMAGTALKVNDISLELFRRGEEL